MTNRVIITAGGEQTLPNTATVVQRIYDMLRTINKETYATVDALEDDAINYPYTIFDFDIEPAGDDQRSEGYYLDLELFDRGTSYMRLYELDTAIRQALDKARIITPDYWYMVKWNRSGQVPTEQRGLLRIAAQYYIKAESRKKAQNG